MKKLAGGIVLIVLSLLLLEAVARVAATIHNDVLRITTSRSEDWFVYSSSLGWERKPGFKGIVGLGEREFDAEGYLAIDSAQIKQNGKRKILFIGDSNTFGFGVSVHQTFAQVVEDLVPDTEAINLGVNGYTSYQGRITVEKYLPVLKPQVVVFSTNFNDRRYLLTRGNDGAQEFERIAIASGHYRALSNSYVYRGMRSMLVRTGTIQLSPEKLGSVRLDTLQPRVSEQSYRSNLMWIVQEAKRQGIVVIFVLLGDNPLQTEHLRKGIAYFNASKNDLAIAYLRNAIHSRNSFSDLARIKLAEVYHTIGDSDSARSVLVSDHPRFSLHGGNPIRLDSRYHAIMREVAMDYGVGLVDGASHLMQKPEYFIDDCHFTADGHHEVGKLVAGMISRLIERKRL